MPKGKKDKSIKLHDKDERFLTQKGRVGDDELEFMFLLSQRRLPREIEIFEAMLDEETPPDTDSGYKRTQLQMMKQRADACRSQHNLIKELIKGYSGVVHPLGKNTKEEKDLAGDIADEIRKEMADKGLAGLMDQAFNPRKKKDDAGDE